MVNDIDKVIGANIARLRGERSQQWLTDAINARGFTWQQSTISKIEHGKQPIRAREVVIFADIFGVSATSLLGEAAAPPVSVPSRDVLERIGRTLFRTAHPQTDWDRDLTDEGRAKWLDRSEPVLRDLAWYLESHAQPFCKCPLPAAEEERLLVAVSGEEAPDMRRAYRRSVQQTMESLAVSYAWLSRETGLDPKTIRTLLNGTRWPHKETRDRIDMALMVAREDVAAERRYRAMTGMDEPREVRAARASARRSRTQSDVCDRGICCKANGHKGPCVV